MRNAAEENAEEHQHTSAKSVRCNCALHIQVFDCNKIIYLHVSVKPWLRVST